MNMYSNAAAHDQESSFGSTAIFSSIKKTIFSKDFRGGSVNNIFGSTLIDFSQADLKGIAVLDINQTLSDTKIVVPQNWRIEIELSQLFSTVSDKRINLNQSYNSNKVLVIRGFSAMANVKIKSGPWLSGE